MFTFKQFSIQQDRCAMKVGTDGVLLGAWAEAREGNVLDVGTGTGLIALMLAQRTKKASVQGVEIVPEAAQQAQENVDASPWKDRVEIVQGDVLQMKVEKKYDEIVSNPPYYENSPKASSAEREIARSITCGFFELLIQFAARNLKKDGLFEVVLPVSVAEEFSYMCWEHNLFLKRQTNVITKKGKPCKRFLLAFMPKQCKFQKDELCLMDETGNKTPEYQSLVKEFYL